MRVRRLDVVDEYIEDGRAAIYTTDSMVVLLSGLATSAWQVLGPDWTPVSDVTEVLVREHGDPGDGRAHDLTTEALRSLAELSLVELDG
jgi:hypothetical protein